MTSIAASRAGASSPPVSRERSSAGALANALVVSAIATVVVAFVLLVWYDGWTYYRTPRTIRGYLPAHRLLSRRAA
jgi:hypothetical protein